MLKIQLKILNKVGIILVLICFVNCSQKKVEDTREDSPSKEVASPNASTDSDTIRYEYASMEEGTELFNKLDYTPESWASGVREVPNIQLYTIPQRWREKTSQEIEVKLKKQLFFRILAPLILSVNADIMSDRNRIAQLKNTPLSDMNETDNDWLKKVSLKYKIIQSEDAVLASDDINELWVRVDIIPTSLALTQSAEESGWGTSRFAAEGNALFGQWAWGENAMKPKEQRSGMGDYGLARFDTPLESMRAYMLNLNTHNAYKELRAKRAQLRKSDLEISGAELAQTLTKYSERGEEYVNTLLSIMRVNKLAQADEAYLKEYPVIIFIPIE